MKFKMGNKLFKSINLKNEFFKEFDKYLFDRRENLLRFNFHKILFIIMKITIKKLLYCL